MCHLYPKYPGLWADMYPAHVYNKIDERVDSLRRCVSELLLLVLYYYCITFAVPCGYCVCVSILLESYPTTRNPVELLGPCFKTGRIVAPILSLRGMSSRGVVGPRMK